MSFLFFVMGSSLVVDAYDPMDPYGNIKIKWDIMSWTPNGYTAMVTIYNNHLYRHIEPPGWELGWTWARQEVIWAMLGAEATEQGNCSKFPGDPLHSCKKKPTVVDLMPGTPYNLQVANCCRGGVLSSQVQNPANSVSLFQITVGSTGTSKTTIFRPRDFILGAPGSGYTCQRTNQVEPSRFPTPDKRRATQAFVTWEITCQYSQFIASKVQTCCVSLSSFYSEKIESCQKCCCGCREDAVHSGTCVESDSPNLQKVLSNSSLTPLLQCTSHMCPIHVHWHIKVNYKLYWRVKITISNFNYRTNYTHWNLLVEHPNLENLTRVISSNYRSLNHGNINDTGVLWGHDYYNDLLITTGPNDFVQSEMLFKKDKSIFTFKDGWAFPRRIYFNGENCVMLPPDQYPPLPNTSTHAIASFINLVLLLVSQVLIRCIRLLMA